MLRTAVFLISTIIIVPVLIYFSGISFSEEQWPILIQGEKIMAGIAFVCFIVSKLAGNYSQTDKIWSLAPIVYAYQTEKHRKIKSVEILNDDQVLGFMNKGLWSIVRHPNFATEQAIWISFYLFSVAATGQWFNWSDTGAILLVLLFFGSSTFTEKVSSGKYPEYQHYKKTVPRFIPSLKKKK